MKSFNKNRKAFALAIVLWISAILVSSTLYILSLYKKSVQNADLLQYKLNAELTCDSVIEKLKYFILTGRFETDYFINSLKGFPSKLYIDGTEQNITSKDFNISIQIISNGSRNPIYSINPIKLNNLVKYFTKKDIDYKSPYMDWIDSDSITRLNGAEEGYYKVLNVKYNISNRGFIQHPDELYLIKNFKNIDLKIRKKINNYFFQSIYSNLVLEALKPEDVLKMVNNLNRYEFSQLNILFKNNKKEYLSKIITLLTKAEYENVSNNKPLTINGYVLVVNKKVRIKKYFVFLNTKYNNKAYVLFKNNLSK